MLLTSLIPLLGFLILFNDQLVGLFRLSATALGIDQEGATRATITQLRFLYLGLLLLGIASLLYRLTCPGEVKEHPTLQSWIEAQKAQVSPAWTKATFRQVLRYYLSAVPLGFSNAFYPATVASRLALMVDGLVQRSNWPDREPSIEKFNADGAGGRRSMIKAIVGVEPEFQDFRRAVVANLEQGHELDLLTLQYQAADFSNPVSRLFVGWLYGMGFCVLAFPAVKNAIIVVALILSGR